MAACGASTRLATYRGISGVFSGTATTTSARADFAGETPRDAFIGNFNVAQ